MIRRQVRYRGRVQGVGFRATARSLASSYKVTGWVCNEADGSVLLEAQGEAAEIDRFLEAIRARLGRLVASENSESAPALPDESSFEIRR